LKELVTQKIQTILRSVTIGKGGEEEADAGLGEEEDGGEVIRSEGVAQLDGNN
jgi:hypothetical protein